MCPSCSALIFLHASTMGELSSVRTGPDVYSLSGIHGDTKLLTLTELWEADYRSPKGIESILGEHDVVGLPSLATEASDSLPWAATLRG